MGGRGREGLWKRKLGAQETGVTTLRGCDGWWRVRVGLSESGNGLKGQSNEGGGECKGGNKG